jgi:hypothetical protein
MNDWLVRFNEKERPALFKDQTEEGILFEAVLLEKIDGVEANKTSILQACYMSIR